MHNSGASRSRSFPFVNILCPAGFLQANNDYLWQQGILGIETIDENRELEVHRIYFEDEFQKLQCLEMMKTLMVDAIIVEQGSVDYRDWESFLHGGFEPLRAGPLYVIPHHDPPLIPDGLTPLRIIPGRGFGTGSHPTTSLCLEYLTDRCGPTDSVLDLGTGSGILAIAGAKLGARPIDAIDIDPDALENARENAEINAVTDSITFSRGSIEAVRGKRYSLVCANIIAHVLKILLEQGLERVVLPGGTLIASGILAEEIDIMAGEFAANGLREEARNTRGDWAALLLRRASE